MKLLPTISSSVALVVATATLAVAQPPPPGPPTPAGAAAPNTGPRFGGRVGVNLANLEEKDAQESTDNRVGFAIGAFAIMPLAPNISLEGGASYAQKGAKANLSELGGGDVTVALDYISIPVVGVYSFPINPTTRIRGFAGANANVLISANVKAGGESMDIGDQTNSFDFGLIGGAGAEVDIGSGMLIIDLRYELGLSNVAKNEGNEDDDVKHRVLSVNAGYAF